MKDEKTENGWRGWLADAAAAAALLTILPLPARWRQGAAWPRALRALPLIGLLTGALSGLVLWLALRLSLPPGVAAWLALLAGIALTGALHEDGLADFADALCGGRTRERRLEIMRDPRSGSFAVLALILALGTQAAALGALARSESAAFAALVVAHVASRAAVVLLLRQLPPARAEGMGHGVGRPAVRHLVWAGGLAFLAAFVMLPPAFSLAAPWLALGAALLAQAGIAGLARRLLGGHTGDVAGAVEVSARTAVLLALAAA